MTHAEAGIHASDVGIGRDQGTVVVGGTDVDLMNNRFMGYC